MTAHAPRLNLFPDNSQTIGTTSSDQRANANFTIAASTKEERELSKGNREILEDESLPVEEKLRLMKIKIQQLETANTELQQNQTSVPQDNAQLKGNQDFLLRDMVKNDYT